MGWFDGKSSIVSSSSRRSASHLSYHSTHHARARHSVPSSFSVGPLGTRSLRSSTSVYSSSSSRRAKPRSGFIIRMIRRIKRLLRDIWRYARRHPMKVLLFLIVPLIASGVLQKLLAMIGVRLPGRLVDDAVRYGRRASGGSLTSSGLSDSLNGVMTVTKIFAKY